MTDHRTPEEAAEILARELYVSEAAMVGRDLDPRRRNWNATLTADNRNGYRRQAKALVASLGELGLSLDWVEES